MNDYRWRSIDPDLVPDRIPAPRVVTLNPASLRMLRALGVMEHVESRCVTPFENMIIYEQVGKAAMNFNFKEHKTSPLVKLEENLV